MSIFKNQSKQFNSGNEKPDRPLVIVTGYYGFDNLGDEAILEELLNEITSMWSKENTVVLSNNPEKTAGLHNVRSVNRWHWFAYMGLLRRSKLLVSGGGGLFQDRTGPLSVVFYAAQIVLARLFGAKVFIYAQGLGPLNTSIGRVLTKFAFQQAETITLRDKNSIDMLNSWGLKGELTSDPVWAMKSSPLPEAVKLTLDNLRLNFPQKKKIIGLSLRTDSALADYHIKLLAGAIASTFSSSATILLLPFQPNQDLEPLEKINQHLEKLGLKTQFLDPELLKKPSHWVALMEHLDLVIGMRMHALLMALQASKPIIGIAYDPKVSLLLNNFQQPSLSLNLKDEEETRIKWFKIIEEANIDVLSDYAKEKLNLTRQLAYQNRKQLSNTLIG